MYLGDARESYLRVEHPARQEDARNVDNVVAATADTGGQGPETNGRCLADDDPGSRRRTEREEHGDDKTQRCLCQRSCSLGRCAGNRHSSGYAKHDKQESVESRTPDVDSSAAKVSGEDPGEHDEDGLKSGRDQTQGEGEVRVNAGLCNLCQHISESM